MQCRFKKNDGSQCEAQAIKGGNLCFSHDPLKADEKHEAVVKGGLSSKKNTLDLPSVKVKTVADVVNLLEDTVNRVRSGEMEIKVANCFGFLSGHLIKAIELSNLEKRIQFIEETLLENKRQLNRNNNEK